MNTKAAMELTFQQGHLAGLNSRIEHLEKQKSRYGDDAEHWQDLMETARCRGYESQAKQLEVMFNKAKEAYDLFDDNITKTKKKIVSVEKRIAQLQNPTYGDSLLLKGGV